MKFYYVANQLTKHVSAGPQPLSHSNTGATKTIENDHELISMGTGAVTDFSHCVVTSLFNMISWFSSSIGPGDLMCDNQQLCPVEQLSIMLRDSRAEEKVGLLS